MRKYLLSYIGIILLACSLQIQARNHTSYARDTDNSQVSSVSSHLMQTIYDEVKTPFKYGMVVAPQDNGHQIDCPTVYREGDKWYMTYVCYNGHHGTDGRGYETWLASSPDLLHWTTLGRLLSYRTEGWDMNQRGGFPSLIDWNWNGTYQMQKYQGNHWMTYIGGHGTGYEGVREPLYIGQAFTGGNITSAHEWQTFPQRILPIEGKDAQWWEKLIQYKSTVYWDRQKVLGHPFVMFYNAGGINPANQMKAERIGIALSDDMHHWQRYADNPVYAHEAHGIITGDAQIVRMPDALIQNQQEKGRPLYVMFYFSAYNPARKYSAYNTFAVSRDLVHWHDWTGTDLVYPSKPYDNLFAHKSYVLKHDGVVYHFYCAVNQSGQRGIALATSAPMGQSEVHFPVPEQKGKRRVMDLDSCWTATLVQVNQSTADLNQIKKVNLPHNFDDYYGYRQLKHGNLHGSAIYEKNFRVSKQTNKRYFLEFQGIGTYATVTFNGHTYPKTPVGRITYTLDITEALLDGNNLLQVRADHPEMITDMPWVCGGCSAEWGFSEGSQPLGIFRPVSLIETDEVRIMPFGVHIWNNHACDSIFIETEVKNYAVRPVTLQLVNKLNQTSGKNYVRLTDSITLSPGESRTVRQQIPIANPHRWNLDDPYLYQLVTMIKRDGQTTDDLITPYGIRSISWPVHNTQSGRDSQEGESRKKQFLLNENPVFINGTCEYEHILGGSHAFTHQQIAARVKEIRQAGFNAFREAHQPHNLYYQQLLDEQGVLFWSQFSAHIWYDTPAFRANFLQFLRQWIKERRNSPSVILWGLQNESVLPRDFAEECSRVIREMDPTAMDQRAITTCNGGEGTDWNVVQNWSGTYGGMLENYHQELQQSDELLNGEYGAWRTVGLHGSDAYSEEHFLHILQSKVQQAEQVKDSVCGQFQWIFATHDNPGRIQPDGGYRRIDKIGPLNHKGLLTIWDEPTVGYDFYQQYTSAQSVASSSTSLTKQPSDESDDSVFITAADRQHDVLKGAAGYTYLYRINCGGDDFTDSYGQTWQQDNTRYSHSWSQDFGAVDQSSTEQSSLNQKSANQTSVNPPSDTVALSPYLASQRTIIQPIHGVSLQDVPLLQSFRYGRQRLWYDFEVPDGNYRIELYFIEPWWGKCQRVSTDAEGLRLFDVAVNDSVVIRDLDIWAESGYAGILRKVITAPSRQGKLRVSFPQVNAGQAVISAIAVARYATDTRQPVSARRLVANNESPTMWHDFDCDTIAKYPKDLSPKEAVAFPVSKYQPTKPGQWLITPGVAREYMLRFRYRNITGHPVRGKIKIVDAKGAELVNRDITFPSTPNKFKVISTTTGTQINAGRYVVSITEAKGVELETLEVQ